MERISKNDLTIGATCYLIRYKGDAGKMAKYVLPIWLSCMFFSPCFIFSDDSQGQTYGAKRQDLWIADVLGVAVKIRKAEEDYEKFYRECNIRSSVQSNATVGSPAERNGDVGQGNSACKKAEEALAMAKLARRQYQLILDQAALASVPVDWLRAHFAWVRWGPEWDRTQSTKSH